MLSSQYVLKTLHVEAGNMVVSLVKNCQHKCEDLSLDPPTM